MDLVIRVSDDMGHVPSVTTVWVFFLFCFGIPLSLYTSNTNTINMYNSYEQVVFRMTALLSTYYGNIILRRVEIIAKSDS